MPRVSIAVLLASAIAVSASGQVVYINNNNPASGSPSPIPFSQLNGYTSLSIYTAAQIAAGGATAGSFLTDLAFAPSGAGTSGTLTLSQARIVIGHLVPMPSPSGWESNFINSVVIHDLASGTFTMPWTGDAWSPLSCASFSGFQWNGVNNIGVFIAINTGASGGFSARVSAVNTRYGVGTFNASTQTPTANGPGAPKVRMTFSSAPGAPPWQGNQPQATLNVDGIGGVPCNPRRATKCAGLPTTINIQSTNVGLGWEMLVTIPTPLVANGAGGIYFPASNQVLNINLGSPGLLFLNNLSFSPFPANASVTVTPPTAVTAAAQLLVLDPSNPSGFALSAPIELLAVNPAPVQGPTGEDSYTFYSLGATPLCGPSSINFYGATYTRIYVSSNGRAMFGAGDALFTPTVAAAMTGNPFVGVWCDLSPNVAGNVTLTSPNPSALRIDFVGVPYFGPTTTVTFGIEFDATLNTVKLDGLAGIGIEPANAPQWVGISGGAVVGATDPGVTSFSPAGSGFTANATDMLYNLGAGGMLTTGLTSITFVLNGLNNYDYLSL